MVSVREEEFKVASELDLEGIPWRAFQVKANTSAKVQRQDAELEFGWRMGSVQETNERCGRGDRQKTVARSCEYCWTRSVLNP